jgi:nucleotide-binding universal stress UspA family protein
MAIKDLLVHVDNSRQCKARIAAAVGLAARHDAHLVGLYVVTPPQIPGYIRAEIGDDILVEQERLIRSLAGKGEELFQDAARRAGIKSEWRTAEGPPVPTVALHARYADIAIVGQRDREEAGDDSAMPDQLVLSVGRPVLVIPYAGRFDVIGERVLVAWDASRLATRAINDALPFLVTAKRVTVMAVNPNKADEDAHGDLPSADICLHLARHGVKADAQQVTAGDLDIGELLLSRAADEGIDLVVMGAYGHARWREVVLGGVTRHMLAEMTVPVLMSH